MKVSTAADRIERIADSAVRLEGLIALMHRHEQEGDGNMAADQSEVIRLANEEVDRISMEITWLREHHQAIKRIPAPSMDEKKLLKGEALT